MTSQGIEDSGGLPSVGVVRGLLTALDRRHFSRDPHARLLEADVTGRVLTVLAWQGGPAPNPGRLIGHRTDIGLRLQECGGDLEAVLLDVLQCQVHEPTAPGRQASGEEPTWLLERYPTATWYT